MTITSGSGENIHSWRQLFSAIVDGSATEEQQQELNELLRRSPAAVDEYLAYIDIHAALSANSIVTVSLSSRPASLVAENRQPQPSRRLSFRFLFAGTALLIAICSLVLLWPGQSRQYAVLTRNVGGDLRHSDLELSVGDGIGQQLCQLTQGVVELEYACGAQLVIEGPARFGCFSAETLVLYEGRLSAEIPPSAIGFRVETPKMEIIDRGTKFGVDVGVEGTSEVHVFQGEVIAKGNTESQSTKLLKGDARRVSETGDASNRFFRNAAFVHRHELADLATGWDSGQKSRWLNAYRKIQQDAAIVACFDFDNEAIQKDIHGTRRVQGRFPGVTAVEFAQPDDHVRFDVAGTYPELTMMTWVRLNNSPTGENSLFHTDNWKTDGQVHWLVADKSQMRFSLHRGDRDPNRHLLRQFWPESRRTIVDDVGRWVHLAATYEAKRQAIRFYINGDFDNEVIDPVIKNAILGPAQIGNWNIDGLPFENRQLSGRMDEFIILSRVMSDEEIQEFARSGSPYPNKSDGVNIVLN